MYKLYNDDCLKILPTIEDKSIDMILCDPPYGTTQSNWDSIIDIGKMFNEYKRIIKDNGAIVVFSAEPFTSKLVYENMDIFKYDIIWDKKRGTDFLNCNRKPLKSHENILIFSKGTIGYHPQYWYSTPYERCKNTDKTTVYGKYKPTYTESKDGRRYPLSVIHFKVTMKHNHPNEKPIELLEWLIKTYSNNGDTILDNTMGSGSVGVACMNTNRNFIGIEMDKDYYNIAIKRISEYDL